MPFVQVTRVKGVSKDQYERIREQATGGKLLDGELFFVDGYQADELWASPRAHGNKEGPTAPLPTPDL